MDATALPRTPVRSILPLCVLLFSLLLVGCLSADGTDPDDRDSADVTSDGEGEDDNPGTEAKLREIVATDTYDPSIISGVVHLSDSANDEPLAGLDPDDFEFLENENPLLDTNFLAVGPIAELPDLAFTQTLSVVFQSNETLTDTETEDIRDTLRQLIDTMPAYQQIALYSFGEEVTDHTEDTGPTSDTDELHEAVDEIDHNEGGGYSAALYEALIEATQPLDNSLELDEGITQGSALLITATTDLAGNESREDVTEALEDFPTAILSMDSNGQDDLAGLTTGPLFHPVADSEGLPDALEDAQASLEAETDSTYAFYYASARRRGDNTLRLGLAPSQSRALDEDLTVDFNADDFSSVSAEIIVFPPDELTQGEAAELDLFTRWSNRTPDYVVESDPDGIDVELINSLDRLRISAEEDASGEQTVELANDAHSGTQTDFTIEVNESDEENGDDDEENGGDDGE